jgi:hypothetical protein
MSQRWVEQVVGRLATDEAFRRQFLADRAAALDELQAGGAELNPCELRALAAVDGRAIVRFAEALDPRIQKSDLKGGCW